MLLLMVDISPASNGRVRTGVYGTIVLAIMQLVLGISSAYNGRERTGVTRVVPLVELLLVLII